MEYISLVVLWSLWCVLHSTMIALRVTDYLKRRLGRGYRYYRLVFNLTAVATLAPLLIYSRLLEGPVVIEWYGVLAWVQWVLLAAGMVLFVLGALKYDLLSFAGIRQIRSGRHHTVMSESGAIDTSGILGLTRHPWYIGAILFVWSNERRIDLPSLIVNVILTVYLVCGTLLEERKLVVEIGHAYRDYQKRVPMLIPWKALRFKK